MDYYTMRKRVAMSVSDYLSVKTKNRAPAAEWVIGMKRKYGVTDKMLNSILKDYGLFFDNGDIIKL